MRVLFIILLGIFLFSCNKKQHVTESLSDALYGFENIQDSARTKTWWFHGETETTKEGITADLEAFKKAGVGGVVYYDQTHGKMENALPAFSKEWWEMLRFSAEEAERLGLTFEVHISNGFVAGGPWITPELGMKKLIATERFIEGGHFFEEALEEPKNRYDFYKDVAVLAFPVQSEASTSRTEKMKVTSNVSGIGYADKIFNPGIALTRIPAKAAKEKGGVYVNIEFERKFTARTITYEVHPQAMATTSATNVPGAPQETFVGTDYRVIPDLGQLEVSDDGVNYRKVCDLKPIYGAHQGIWQKTISFSAAKGKYFRLNFHHWWDDIMKDQDIRIGNVVLGSSAKLDQWEEKAALQSEYIEHDQTPGFTKEEVINSKAIVNLTDKMDKNGVLRWDVPEGKWLIMRFAYVPTGGYTKHGRKNLMGLECDKLSAEAVTVQWDNYVAKIADSLKATHSGHLSGVVMDSHEAGAQNWTDDFVEQFKYRQGYDPMTYLPAMLGYVVDGVKESDGFLFDVRRNIADMMADNYYATVEKLCNERGLIFTAQAIGNALCFVGDPIQAKGKVSKPQGEFWVWHPDGNYDIKESSSAAHLYGKKIASAEAFTEVRYNESLAEIKNLADCAYAYGINEFVICASIYQPWLDKVPGATAGKWHWAINRNNTWWDYSGPFWDFQARNAHIMRQGKSSIDLCVYLGENAPVKILTYRLPEIPAGFDFDAFTSDALFTRMDASNGMITLPDGVSYQMMILPGNGDITLDALRKIASMVEKGAKIYGPKPMNSGSERDTGKDTEYQNLVDKLWGRTSDVSGVNYVGDGRVYWGMPLANAIEQVNIIPDITLETGNAKENKIYFVHRKLSDADVYFMNNHKDDAEDNVFTFKACGKYAQLWNTVTGERFSLPVLKPDNETTSINLYFHPRESYFVMITDKQENLQSVDWYKPSDHIELIEGSWDVFFDSKWGGPGNVTFNVLSDWTVNDDPHIKYYSGTAVYKKTISMDATDERIYLDLGNPGFVARVFVNSNDAGIVWCSPWNLEITKYLVKGENYLEIHVANSLANRILYDASLPESERITYSDLPIILPNTEPVPSGLKEVKLIWK